MGAIINGADEQAVSMFLNNEIAFLDIETSIIKASESIEYIQNPTLEDILESDRKAREFVRELWKGANE